MTDIGDWSTSFSEHQLFEREIYGFFRREINICELRMSGIGC